MNAVEFLDSVITVGPERLLSKVCEADCTLLW